MHRDLRKGTITQNEVIMLYEFEEITDVVGCCCTLLFKKRGHSEGYIVGDYGKDVVVRLNNGKEIVERRNDVLINE